MSTTLDASLMRSILLATSFRGGDMDRACAALLMIGLQGCDFDSGMLPAEITGDSKQLAGMATASLCAQGLIECVGRVRSSSPLANGRKVNLWRIPAPRVSTVRTWLALRGYAHTEAEQLSLAV